jgi:hypothetical protein
LAYVGGPAFGSGRFLLGLELDLGPLNIDAVLSDGCLDETVLAVVSTRVLNWLTARTPSRENYHAGLSGMM